MVNRKIRNFVTQVVRYTKVLLLLFDIIVLNLSFFVAVLIRFGDLSFPYQEDYLKLLLLGNVIWVLLIGVFDAYKVMRFEPVENTLYRTIKMVVVHFLLLMLVTYIIDFRDSSRLLLFVFVGLLFFGVILYRVALFRVLKYLRRRGINHKVVAIVGYNDNAKAIYEVLTSDISYGYRVMGFFTDEDVNPKEVRYIGTIDSIEEELKKWQIEEMYIALAVTNAGRVKRIFKLCDRYGVRVKIIPDFQKYTASHRVQIRYYSHVPVLRMRTEPLSYFSNKLLKRTFDVVFATVVLVGFLSWIYPLVWLIMKSTSRHPVLFKQRRSGLDGRTFICLKIRTMVPNAKEDAMGTLVDDPRVTKFGKFLRRSKIDELPQFINVFLGQMSVVGPRPHMLIHTEEYSEMINTFMVRHYVKPGITGWAQTVGYLNPDQKLKEMRDKVKNDIWYIENWSFLLDMKIILNTAIDIFKPQNHDKRQKKNSQNI